MNKKSIPEIRFQNFEGQWLDKSLCDLSNKVKEKNKDLLFSETLTNSAEFGIINQRDFFDKDISNIKNLDSYYIVRNNDFVYNPRISNYAPVGPVKRNRLGRTGVMSPLYYVFRVNASIVDLDYLEKYFDSSFWHKFMRLNGDSGARSDRFAIKDSIFQEMPIPLPSVSEQSAIGSLFRTLDDLLAAYKENLANYKTFKASMLSKMFPKAGQKVPEIRLAEFEGEWEEKEFTKIVKRVSTSSSSSQLPKVEYEDIVSGQGRLNKDVSNKFDNRKGIHFKPGYTLYGKLRPYLNNWLLPKFEGVALGDFWVFDPNGYNPEFIYYLIQSSHYQKVANDTSGTKMPRSDWKSVSTTNFALPSTIKEQVAIGSFFSNLDTFISSYQDKTSQLETLKKKLLQDMFI